MSNSRCKNKRTRSQREQDELTIADLTLKGWTHRAIAERLGLHRSMITKTLGKLRRKWAAETMQSMDEAIAQELERLKMLEVEYWSGWERSQQQFEKNSIERISGGDGDGGRIRAARQIETRIGDPSFLNGIQRVIDARIKLLGLAPTTELKILELAETQVRAEFNALFEAILEDPTIPDEVKEKLFLKATEVQAMAAAAPAN